ncbi:MAG: hypothetical protein D6741_01670 [Planctomycetota bacterium]|nr:MAG: hypothetical protein D6741_01670 [Planctomycetota bacterium]
MFRFRVLTILVAAGVWASFASIGPRAVAASNDRLDWSVWEEIPIYDDGRIKPILGWAREMADTICGKTSPTLSPPQNAPDDNWKPLFPEGKPRKFTPAELVFSWIVEPERWEHVAFLPAAHEQLRQDLLGLAVNDTAGKRINFVSPAEVARASAYQAWMEDLMRRREAVESSGRTFRLVGVDRKAQELWTAYQTFRLLSYSAVRQPGESRPFFATLRNALGNWQELEPELTGLASIGLFGNENPIDAISSDFDKLKNLVSQGGELADFDAVLVDLKRQTGRVVKALDDLGQRGRKDSTTDAERMKSIQGALLTLSTKTKTLDQQVQSLHLFLYEQGTFTLHVVPALYEVCLIVDRESDIALQPWISLPALLYGSDDLLRGYPKDDIEKARTAFQHAVKVYRDRKYPNRAEAFRRALVDFRGALRNIGEAVEPLRKELDVPESSRDVLAQTAYPPPGYVLREVHYYRVDPFLWSWVFNLCAFLVLVLSVGKLRSPLFWLGIVLLVLAQAVTIYGFTLRVLITGWAPVTNMFESVVFVSLVMGLLAIGFSLRPLYGEGLTRAWRMTGIPGTWETKSLKGESSVWAKIMPVVNLIPRALLTGVIFYLLAIRPYGAAANRPVFDLLPEGLLDATARGAAVGVLANSLLGWSVGILILLSASWYVPRAMLTVLIAAVTIPASLGKGRFRTALADCVRRMPFAKAGAALAFLVAVVAYFTPVWNSDITSIQPILRDRMWLFAHVLTVTAGYGGGLLAWGLGNAALFYYLVGKYRRRELSGEGTTASGEVHRPADGGIGAATAVYPPQQCLDLGAYMYKAVKVSVVLLVAGTILGGVWADRSWGRFWGWDPKEVWALISILVYMVIMHGRYARWLNNFGLAAGSVFGMIAIVWAWYGVNFLMGPGLHSYAGEGGGGGEYIVAFFTLNLLFVGAAYLRYRKEMPSPNQTDHSPESNLAATQPEKPQSDTDANVEETVS